MFNILAKRKEKRLFQKHSRMVQGDLGSLFLLADQVNLQYHGIQPDPEDPGVHRYPADRSEKLNNDDWTKQNSKWDI